MCNFVLVFVISIKSSSLIVWKFTLLLRPLVSSIRRNHQRPTSDLVVKMITLRKSANRNIVCGRFQSTIKCLILENQQQRQCSSNSKFDGESKTPTKSGTSSLSSSLSSSLYSKRTSPSSAGLSSSMVKKIPDNEIRKSVFISQSNDIFANLALEDWLYRHFDFCRHHVLLLWSNNPCVVIGRHQIPFLETNVSRLEDYNITLARRNSGGGTVYHDRGNLNCTFFMPRERYDRKYNLNILTRALFREWAIKAEINHRDDILINDKKVK